MGRGNSDCIVGLAPTAERPKFLNLAQLTQEGKEAGAELVRGHSSWAAGQCKLSSKFLCQAGLVSCAMSSSFPLTTRGLCAAEPAQSFPPSAAGGVGRRRQLRPQAAPRVCTMELMGLSTLQQREKPTLGQSRRLQGVEKCQ